MIMNRLFHPLCEIICGFTCGYYQDWAASRGLLCWSDTAYIARPYRALLSSGNGAPGRPMTAAPAAPGLNADSTQAGLKPLPVALGPIVTDVPSNNIRLLNKSNPVFKLWRCLLHLFCTKYVGLHPATIAKCFTMCN